MKEGGGEEGDHERECAGVCVYYCRCVFITTGPIIKLCAGGEGDSEGHVLCGAKTRTPGV